MLQNRIGRKVSIPRQDRLRLHRQQREKKGLKGIVRGRRRRRKGENGESGGWGREEEKRRWNDDVTVDGLRPNFKGGQWEWTLFG